MSDLFRLLRRCPQLVSSTPKLVKYHHLLKPYSIVLCEYSEALAPHLPRILDNMYVLEPYLPEMFDVLPSLIPYLGLLLDELPALEPHLPSIVAHREYLLPELPYIAPRLKPLRPHHHVFAPRLDKLAPYLSSLAPCLDLLMLHMPLVAEKIDQLLPHLPLMTQEDALQTLLPHADELLRSDLSMLSGSVPRFPPGTTMTEGRTQLLAVLSSKSPNGDEDQRSELDEASARASNAVSKSRADQNGHDFWAGVRRTTMLIFGGAKGGAAGTSAAPASAAALTPEEFAAMIGRINSQIDVAGQQMKGLEKDFVAFKESMHWRQQKDQAAALRLATLEGGLIEVEDALLELAGATGQLRVDTETHARKIGPEAIKRGREKLLVTSARPVPVASVDAKTDSFLWRLPL